MADGTAGRARHAAARAIRAFARMLGERRFRPGALVAGRYRIRERLGMGGYGVAYLADDLRGRRTCVLKRVYPLRGGGVRAPIVWQRETELLERLGEPACPRLFERFRWHGHYLFAMERMEGVTLERLLFDEDRRIGEAEALGMVRQLLALLGRLHRAGIVHRDIGPANVLWNGESVRLIDFGLARELGSAGAERGGPPSQDPDEAGTDAPPEKRLRRLLHPSGDLYATGHLLLFLLYSGYEGRDEGAAGERRSWEEELRLAPDTARLLRRLLMTEQPYANAGEAVRVIDAILESLRGSKGGQLLDE